MQQKLLQHINKTVSLTQEEVDFIVTHFSFRRLLKHQYLVQEGNYVDYDYLVVSGLVKSYYLDELGKEHIVLFAAEDSWITDTQAFQTQAKATLNITCLENTEVFYISSKQKEALCAGSHKMEHFFRTKTTEGYIAMQRRIQCLISHSAGERYRHLIETQPNLIQRVPKSMIASFLGVSRETLSRLHAY